MDEYTDQFFKLRRKFNSRQIQIAQKIAKILDIKSVIDYGAGVGGFLQGFQKSGCSCLGIEYGYDNAKKYIPSDLHIIKGDLTEFVDYGKFDLTLCIEVIEHIPAKFEQMAIFNLLCSSNKYIILTTSEDKSGVNHVNCQPREYWIEKIQEKYYNSKTELPLFKYNENLVKEIIKEINPCSPHNKRFSRNLMVFNR